MIKTITKIGNSREIIFDAALMELAHLKPGDRVNLSVHEGGTICITPLQLEINPAKAAGTARRLIRKNPALFRRLSK